MVHSRHKASLAQTRQIFKIPRRSSRRRGEEEGEGRVQGGLRVWAVGQVTRQKD